MSPRTSILAGLALAVAVASAAEYDDMGPAAFLWPPDRVWAASADNNAPCGSVASPGNRTEFPMENGKIALVAQDDSWEVELSISYSKDPKSNDDFNTLLDGDYFREMDPGHTCIPITDSPDSVTAGDYATLQIMYIADFDTPENQTFYACADIKFVETDAFDVAIPCFNATEPDAEDSAGSEWDYHDNFDDDDDEEDNDKSDEASPSSTSSPDAAEGGSGEKKSGGSGSDLSGGTIAGIVVGCVAGVGFIATAALLVYRRKSQRLQEIRKANSSRGVAWDGTGKSSISSSSVRMQNMSA